MANTPGKGTVLQITITATPTTIAQGVSITPPQRSNPPIDTTILTDSARTFIGSVIDNGEVSFSGNYDGSAVTHTKLETDFAAGTIAAWTLILADAAACTMTFSGIITSLSYGAATIDGLVTINITIKVTGSLTITP